MKKDRFLLQILFLGFGILASFALLVSCHSVSGKQGTAVFTQPDSIYAPVIVEVGPFEVRNLDNMAPPQVVSLSDKPAPVTTQAGFYVTMPNFNTEHGLALSSLICSYKDKAGNLWFGSSGNGASMYNGKTFVNYFSTHGLIHNFISAITEDHLGNIWFGTYGGVSKYNGVTFENFTTKQGLIDNDIYRIREDQNGNVWVATAGGLSRYSPSDTTNGAPLFVNYESSDGLIDGTISDILEDQNGFLWFAGDGGISRYDPIADAMGKSAFQDYTKAFGLSDEYVNSLLEDESGNIWAGTDKLVSRYTPVGSAGSGPSFHHFTVADGLVDNFILSSIEDREGYLWFGTKGGVSRYSSTDDSFLNFTTEQGLADNQVMSIVEDDAGTLWFSTYGGGVSKYEGSSVIEYAGQQGLPGKAIYAITEDRHNNLWFAPLNGGLVQYKGNPGAGPYQGTFVNYTTEQGFPSSTAYNSVEDNAGNLWFGTIAGLCKFDGKRFTTYTTKQGLPDDYITALSIDSQGNLWIGTYDGGVSVFDGQTFTNFSTEQGLVHKTVWSFLEDREGIHWIATRGGLSRYDGQRFMNFTTAQGLPDNKLSTVMQDRKGNILIGGWGGGVSIIRKPDVDRLSQPDPGDFHHNIFDHFSSADGLANNVVYKILEDHSGNIVIGSSYGFTILKGGINSDEEGISKYRIENYNEHTGYPIKDVSNNYSLIEDHRGLYWIGTGDKLVRFDYSSVHKSQKPLQVSIESIKINMEPISWRTLDWARADENRTFPQSYNVPTYVTDELLTLGRTLNQSERDTLISSFRNVRFDGVRAFHPIPNNLVLPYAQNDITFDFIGVETTRPKMVRYRYKLEGSDKKWSPVTDKSTVTFGNIFEGNYTFLVMARNPAGVWSDPISYQFEVLPPWYRSWMAYLFYTLIFIAGVLVVDRIMRNRVITKERERTMQREVDQAKEIEKAFKRLETAHQSLKAAQKQLVQQEKLASLGQLTAGIAHEIKNPLNFVNNFSEVSIELLEELREGLKELLKQKNRREQAGQFHPTPQPLVESHTEGNANGDGAISSEPSMDPETVGALLNDIETNLQKISEHGHRADRIVKSMLKHSRSSSGVMQQVHLNTLIKEFTNLAFHGMRASENPMNVDITLDLDEQIGEVALIADDFSRVIVNLCNNAFDAMREKEDQTEQQGIAYNPSLTVRTISKTDQVIIEITDNGAGVPEDIKDNIMQAFFTTKIGTEGTGLGLYITNDIIKAHGGSIEVKSEEGVFTTFTVTLPTQL
jgi:signal transduction histidine kinase/ligand-binding sensor domain-containing protein